MHMDDEQRQYHLEEYKTLKHELAEAFKEAFQIVIFSVTANAAIFTFVSGHAETERRSFYCLLSLLPIFVSLASYALYLLRRRSITRITRYLYKLEAVFAADDLGWERLQHRVRRHCNTDLRADQRRTGMGRCQAPFLLGCSPLSAAVALVPPELVWFAETGKRGWRHDLHPGVRHTSLDGFNAIDVINRPHQAAFLGGQSSASFP